MSKIIKFINIIKDIFLFVFMIFLIFIFCNLYIEKNNNKITKIPSYEEWFLESMKWETFCTTRGGTSFSQNINNDHVYYCENGDHTHIK